MALWLSTSTGRVALASEGWAIRQISACRYRVMGCRPRRPLFEQHGNHGRSCFTTAAPRSAQKRSCDVRASRIPHPLGSRFIQVWEWAVRTIGRDAAIVMAEIDFLDRAQDAPGQPVASRARILADLEGLVGRNSLDNALRILVEAGWLKRHERRTLGPFNIQRSYEFSLDAVAIAASLGHSMKDSDSGDPDVPISETRQSPNRDQSRNLIREPLERIEVDEAAAPSKRAIVAAAADRSSPIQGKRRRKRPSGIVTWVPEDEEEALRIEAVASPDDIVNAIARLCRNEKQPVPGMVAIELERMASEEQRERQRSEDEKRHQSALNAKPEDDVSAFEIGLKLMPNTVRESVLARRSSAQPAPGAQATALNGSIDFPASPRIPANH